MSYDFQHDSVAADNKILADIERCTVFLQQTIGHSSFVIIVLLLLQFYLLFIVCADVMQYHVVVDFVHKTLTTARKTLFLSSSVVLPFMWIEC